MKRFLLILVSVIIFSFSKATSYQWVVAGPGLWDVPTNWSPNGIPGAGDDVLITSFGFPIGTPAIRVTLPNTAVSVNSIILTGTLTIAVILQLPITNTLTPGFSVTGPGDAMFINNNGSFVNSSGAVSGNTFVITNTLRINGGGTYAHNTLSNDANIVSQLSTAIGTELGVFNYSIPGGGVHPVSISGGTFGSLLFDSNGAGVNNTYSASGTGADCLVRGILTNYAFDLFISMRGDIIVLRDLISFGNIDLQTGNENNRLRVGGNVTFFGGTLTETGTGLPTFELEGIVNQYVSSSGSQFLLNSVSLVINNAAGITLTDNLTVPYKVYFQLGKVHTTAFAMMVFLDDCVSLLASNLSFIEGPARKIGDDDFAFPIGVGGIFAPIGINNVALEQPTDEFVAEYKRTNPQSIHGAAVQGGQDHVSYVEYWTLTREVGTAIKSVILSVNYASFCHDLTRTYVSRWNAAGPFWIKEPTNPFQTGYVAPNYQGILVSGATSAFGDFTLITDLIGTANPLPIKLLTFTAVKNNNSSSTLKWELSDVCSKDARFEVEKSINGRDFTRIMLIPGSETNKLYNVQDNQLGKGVTYYRLKMIDYDGTITYSPIVIVINNNGEILITSLNPNPVQTTATLTISSANQDGITFRVMDISGRIAKEWYSHLQNGINKIPVDFSNLPAGVYHIIASTSEVKTSLRFMKQ